MKIRHYRQIYEDFARLLFLHAHREASILAGELPEESEQFRFLRASRLSNLKDSVDLILPKTSSASHYSHRFVYEVFHTFTSLFELSSSASSS
jgi:hypothetical protein